MKETPTTGGELIRHLHAIADALYKDLKRDGPDGDKAFETRLHECILTLKRFEIVMKNEA